MSEDDNGIETNLPERPEQQVPAEPTENQQVHIAGVQVTKTWSAPLPPPQLLREFNEAVPGAADIIISEFQEQGQHRRDMERQTTEAHVFAVKAGAIWPPAMDALLVLSGFGSIVAGRPFIGAGILLFVMIAILAIRWFQTPDEGESEATRDSEDSGKDDEETPT
ncbi:DUF2335 domain-containing protein [Candidatus Palauibacter sp.]|uniref:DUF2335 domain-containing protein n=1 Tax=Candidatus Palauibacter sp. TaxID=3101350 RepID=UPI003B026580